MSGKDLLIKPERVYDFIENKRVMPLKMAISIADSIGCEIRDLYELIPNDNDDSIEIGANCIK